MGARKKTTDPNFSVIHDIFGYVLQKRTYIRVSLHSRQKRLSLYLEATNTAIAISFERKGRVSKVNIWFPSINCPVL